MLITHLPQMPQLPVKSTASEQETNTSSHSFLQPALPKRLKNGSKLLSKNLNIIVEDEDSEDDDIINAIFTGEEESPTLEEHEHVIE